MNLSLERARRPIQGFRVFAQGRGNALHVSAEASQLFLRTIEEALEALGKLASDTGPILVRARLLETPQSQATCVPFCAQASQSLLSGTQLFAAGLEAAASDGQLTALTEQ